MTNPQIIAVVARALVTHAEFAAVRAFVRQIDIHVAVQLVHIGIFAVFFIAVFPVVSAAPAVFVFVRVPRGIHSAIFRLIFIAAARIIAAARAVIAVAAVIADRRVLHVAAVAAVRIIVVAVISVKFTVFIVIAHNNSPLFRRARRAAYRTPAAAKIQPLKVR